MTTRTMKRLPASRKIRMIVSGVSFYTTAKNVRSGVGDFMKVNAATQKALDALEYIRSGDGIGEQCTMGLAGNWEGLSVQITLM